MTTAVSSSGSLTAVTSQNLGFLKGGQLKTVDVKVGQKVTRGAVVRPPSTTRSCGTVRQQQLPAPLAQAVFVNATTVTGAENTMLQAGETLDATQDQASATVDADDVAVERARKQLDFDEHVSDDIDDQLDQAENARRRVRRHAVELVDRPTSGLLSGPQSTPTATVMTTPRRSARSGSRPRLTPAEASPARSCRRPPRSRTRPALQAATLQSALTGPQPQVVPSRTALEQAEARRDVDEASSRVQVENARQGVVTAQNNLESAQAGTGRRSPRSSAGSSRRGRGGLRRRRTSTTPSRAPPRTARSPPWTPPSARSSPRRRGHHPARAAQTAAIPGADTPTSPAAGTVSRPGGTQFLVLDNRRHLPGRRAVRGAPHGVACVTQPTGGRAL